jgi:hypothetical protein
MSVNIDVCFREELEIFSYKLDSFAMSTVDIHDIFFDGFFVVVELLDEPIHESFFSGSTDPIKQEMRYFPMCNEICEFVLQVWVESRVGMGRCRSSGLVVECRCSDLCS